MTYKYEKLMQEWETNMDNPVLDKAFVAKVEDFKQKLEKKSLTDEEIAIADDELCKLFKELHKLEEVESEDVKRANHKVRVAEAKEEIASAETIQALKILQSKFDDLPELQPFIAKRIEKLDKVENDQQLQQTIAKGKEEIKSAPYSNLPGLIEKYKDHAELVALINQRIEKEKPSEDLTIRQKLANAKKKRFTYDELRAMGIKITGDDMEIEGIYLERQYLFKIYEITSIDGKPA